MVNIRSELLRHYFSFFYICQLYYNMQLFPAYKGYLKVKVQEDKQYYM